MIQGRRKNQINKAIAVAQESGSLAVLYNWLMYQAARDKSKSFWIQGCGEENLIKRLVQEMKKIESDVRDQLSDLDEDDVMGCATEAVVRFLGFFARAYNGQEYLHLYFGGGRQMIANNALPFYRLSNILIIKVTWFAVRELEWGRI